MKIYVDAVMKNALNSRMKRELRKFYFISAAKMSMQKAIEMDE